MNSMTFSSNIYNLFLIGVLKTCIYLNGYYMFDEEKIVLLYKSHEYFHLGMIIKCCVFWWYYLNGILR